MRSTELRRPETPTRTRSRNDSGTRGLGVVPKSRISLDTGLRDCPVPATPSALRIILSESDSDTLASAGE